MSYRQKLIERAHGTQQFKTYRIEFINRKKVHINMVKTCTDEMLIGMNGQ